MMEQEPKKITDRQVSETSIGPVCMSKTEYTMYQEEMAKKIGNQHIIIPKLESNIFFSGDYLTKKEIENTIQESKDRQ